MPDVNIDSGKLTLTGNDARAKIIAGVDRVADIVKATLGPCGRNVVLQRDWGSPLIINDGVTIAKEITSNDPFEDMGCELMKEVAERTLENAGDGTTTATLLAQEIIHKGMEEIADGKDPQSLRRELSDACKLMVEKLKSEARDVTDEATLTEVAIISANGDTELGSMIAKGMFAVGPKGVMSVDPSGTADTTLDMVDGIQLDIGYISPYMVTDIGRREAVLENPFILCYDDSITELKECLPLLEEIAKRKRPLFIICKNIGPEALVNILTNAQRGVLQIVATRMPGFGDSKLEILKDVGALTAAVVLTEMDTGIHLCDATMAHLGEAKRVRVTQDKTVIIQGMGDEDEIRDRIAIVEQQILTEKVDKIKKDMKDRLGGLQGKVAVLHVGATTESELREKVARVDDAIQATRAALQEGIVRGGGVALRRATINATTTGAEILNLVAIAPYGQISRNAGTVAEPNKDWTGYNLFGKPAKDMFDAGIIDPLRVVRVALENAVSIAGLILTTEAVVRREKDTPEGINLQRR